MADEYKICVEYKPVTVPNPTGFAVIRKSDNKPVAYLTADQIRDALQRFDDMERDHADWLAKFTAHTTNRTE